MLKVLSWNIWFDGNFDEIARFLASSDADIIGLQEVVPDDPTRDIIGYLSKLGYHHVVAPVKKLKDGRTMSNAVFSKYEIVSSETHVISEAESRNAVQADILVGNTTLHVFSTHLLHTHQQPSGIQTLQASNLLKVVPQKHSIVMGDFNATPESEAMQKMRESMIDANPASIPTLDPEAFDCPECDQKTITDICLDYIFTSKDLLANDFQVHKVRGSDHLPISAVIKLI